MQTTTANGSAMCEHLLHRASAQCLAGRGGAPVKPLHVEAIASAAT